MKHSICSHLRLLTLILASLILGSCTVEVKTPPASTSDKWSYVYSVNHPADEGSSEDGEGEDGEAEGETEGSTEAEENMEGAVQNATNGSSWKKENGKYVYTFHERDDSGMATVDEMYSTSTEALADQPDDWYIGKVVYDLSSGEYSIAWDRYQSTLDIVKKYHAIYRGDETRKVCYLTFDCGYEYGTTASILDTLKEKEAPATFFVTGSYVKTEDELMSRMINEGHIIGNHTMNHQKMTTLSVDEFVEELESLEELYYSKFPDADPMIYFRPPSGSINEWGFKLADKMGYHTVMWSFAYYDFDVDNQPDVSEALTKAKEGLHNGCVYLFHAESQTNADMLGDLIDWIRGEGYEILPLCDIET